MELTYPVKRRRSRAVRTGDIIIGGGFPISIQSMTNTDTQDVAATVRQATELFDAGCDIVRLAVPNQAAADCLSAIREQIAKPLVADIHFQHKLALAAIAAGFDKVRINPGNIGAKWKVREVAQAAGDAGVPIRIGVNSGSLPKDLLEKFGHSDPKAFVEAALREIEILEGMNFKDIIISVKSTSANISFWAYRMLGDRCDYPLHVGITEAGLLETGTIKSSVGMGAILLTGVGDTIRVSLTADPLHEVRVARQILKACELRSDGVEVISCPTCGRAQIDLIGLAESVEEKTRHIKMPLKVAVMGCVVNGPGEAAAADVGVAGGDGKGILIRKGEIVRRLAEADLEQALLDEIEAITGERIER
ncbi:MAG: flavodoxin-dependent (E)-4-hydroxy-3-methylbut-2-enyl-diphosphate synthase [candidate division Zixibacteria bacterium]|nr:flavodoxin-dependent (E)-4-hydroxy-3-methylbut-2-enyl-diphosphate synthase [candidate division Zixibacteria bacterium]